MSKKLTTVWKCHQISKFSGEKMVAGLSPVNDKKLNKEILNKQPAIGDIKIQAEMKKAGYDFFEDGKFYLLEFSETEGPKDE